MIFRVLRSLLPLGLLAVIPALAFSQVTLVKATPCGAEAFPGSCTVPATGAGHLLVIGFQLQGGSTSTTITSITDNVGNVYAEAGSAHATDTAGADMVDIWYAKNSVAGATSITVTTSASMTSCAALLWEFAGADLTAPLDQSSVLNSQAATTTPSGAAVTIGSANEVILSLADVADGITGMVAGNPFMDQQSVFTSGWPNVSGWAYLITTAPGTYAAQWAQNASGTYTSSTVSFKAASTSSGYSACDVNKDGSTNVVDSQIAANNASNCTASSFQTFYPQVVTGIFSSCPVTTGVHTVALNWSASTTSGVTYNVYRASSSGGYNYASPLATSISGTSFTDCTVALGQSYYYVIRAVDGSGNQSASSSEVSVNVPTT